MAARSRTNKKSTKSRRGQLLNVPSRFSRGQLLGFALVFAAIGGYLLWDTFAAIPSTETREGTFVIKCTFSHRAQVDPIVQPGPKGTLSGHDHTFTGNRSTDSDSTYASMTAAGTTCAHPGDTAGYWTPTLLRPDGSPVTPIFSFAYYKNIPVTYGTTTAFPKDFRMIAGGVGNENRHRWHCFNTGGDSDTPMSCTGSGNYLVSTLNFPSCWDGKNIDSPNHRSHVAYATGQGCPTTHPVKVPRINFFTRWCANCGGPDWKLSDGTTIVHADFWNTWQQPALQALVDRCLKAGINCGQVKN